MHVFSTKVVRLADAPPDPNKHVRFSDGMILGVDDFRQEFAYLSHHDRWICRDLIGYGTVSGLSVRVEDDGARGPRVVVEPGVAVTPRGELLRVPVAQCANLNEWLAGKDQVDYLRGRPGPLSPPGDRVDLYVTLCYRECELDEVPIPGEPCRREDDMTAPSRIMDDFRLELRFAPPEQPDEAAIRDFVEWLSMIPIVDGPSSVPLDTFLGAIRSAAFLIGSPPASPPDFMHGVPPANILIGRADACQYLRAAYRVWITDLRPRWHAAWWLEHGRCDGSRTETPAKTPEPCLLLTRLDVPLVPAALGGPMRWQVPSAGAVTVDETQRPILAPLRMLQEWLWCGSRTGAAISGPSIVAAGSVVVGNLPSGPFQLEAFDEKAGVARIRFAGFTFPGSSYAIAALPAAGVVKNPRLEYVDTVAGGIRLRVKEGSGRLAGPIAGLELMVQVTRVA